MKIVRIFDGKLYVIRYKGERYDELQRLLRLWSDPKYLQSFLIENHADIPYGSSLSQIMKTIKENACELDETMDLLGNDKNRALTEFFKPLYNQEYKVQSLSKQKGRTNYLRLYAIKIDANCFLITGGAIKLTQMMEDRKHTNDELAKLEHCRSFLKSNGVFDSISFFDFLTE